MKIIFLDIDGVLNSVETFINRLSKKELEIEEEKVKILKEIIDKTNALIVLISSWKIFFDENLNPIDFKAIELVKLLNKYGISIYDKTPSLGNREKEIEKWLENKEVFSFIIIDDDISCYDKLKNSCIKTYYSNNLELGLSNNNVITSIEKLKIKRR